MLPNLPAQSTFPGDRPPQPSAAVGAFPPVADRIQRTACVGTWQYIGSWVDTRTGSGTVGWDERKGAGCRRR